MGYILYGMENGDNNLLLSSRMTQSNEPTDAA